MMPPVVLVTGTSRPAAGLRHHHSAQQHAEVVDRRSARRRDHLADGDADGHAQRDGVADGAGDGEILLRHRLVQANVHQGLDVGDHRVHVLGQPAGRDDAAGDDVDQDELVARRIGVRQRWRRGCSSGRLLLHRGDDVVVLFLDADDALRRADHLHGRQHSAQERLGVVVQQLLVLVQQRLALGRVGDDQRHARPQLHRRGKSSAACAHDAQLAHAIWGHLAAILPLAAPITRPTCLWCHRAKSSKSFTILIDSDSQYTIWFSCSQERS